MDIDFSSIRGFNYQPGYNSHLQYTWTNFDRESWEREVPHALRFGANMLRVWLDWSAFLAAGDRMLDAVDEALQVMDRHGLKMMPVLFNRWTDARYPAGGVSTENLQRAGWDFDAFLPYVDSLAERFGEDPRIGIWDLCNEPQAPHGAADVALRESTWLMRVTERLRDRVAAPVTIGTMSYDFVRLFAPIVDVISFHPYPAEIGTMRKLCEDHLAIADRYGKRLLCTETCKGSLDDHERGELARDCIETLDEFGIGWLAWQLCSGQFVTGSREKTDSNAVRPNEGYMVFVLPDGTTRPGHEWLERR